MVAIPDPPRGVRNQVSQGPGDAVLVPGAVLGEGFQAFQAAGCSRARTDWVMVCSSTLMAMAVIHSAKRWKPRREKAHAKVLSKTCQMDQVSLASVIMRLLCRGQLGFVTTWQVPTRRRCFSIRYACSVVVEFFVETTVRTEEVDLLEVEVRVLGQGSADELRS